MANRNSTETNSCIAICDCSRIPKIFTDNVETTLAQIKGETNWKTQVDGFVCQNYWDKQSALTAFLHKEVTKLSVAYTNPPLPKCADAEKLFDGIMQCVLALVSSLYHLPLQQGQTLFKKWRTFHISLFTALLEYSKSLWSGNQQSVAQCTGAIWELCSAASTLPKNNKQCLDPELKQVLELVVDALTELEQAKSSYSSGDTDTSHEPVSEYDLMVLTAGVGLVKTTKILINKAAKAVQMNGKADTEQQVVDCDVLSELVGMTSEVVDDFSAALYPPSNKQEVKECIGPLVDHISCLLNTFRQSHFCTDSEAQWTAVVENAISHNDTKVRSLVT